MPKLYRITGTRYLAEKRQEQRVETVLIGATLSLTRSDKEQVISHVVSTRFNDSWYVPEGGWTEKQFMDNPPWIKAVWLPTGDTDKPALYLKMMEEYRDIKVEYVIVKEPIILRATTPAIFVSEGDPLDAIVDYLTSDPQRLRALLRHTPLVPYSNGRGTVLQSYTREGKPAPATQMVSTPLPEQEKDGALLRAAVEQTWGSLSPEDARRHQLTLRAMGIDVPETLVALAGSIASVEAKDSVPAPADNPAVQAVTERFASVLAKAADLEPEDEAQPRLPHEMAHLNEVRSELRRIAELVKSKSLNGIKDHITAELGDLTDSIDVRLRDLTKFDTATVPPHQGAGITMVYQKLALVEALLQNGDAGDRDYGLVLLKKLHDDFQRFLRDESRPADAQVPLAREASVVSVLEELVEKAGVVQTFAQGASSSLHIARLVHGREWVRFTRALRRANDFMAEYVEATGTVVPPQPSTIPTSPNAATEGPTT